MSLFNKKSKIKGALFGDPVYPSQIKPEVLNYNTVVEYLEGLSSVDYSKVLEVVGIYREANKKAATALGEEYLPTTYIKPPKTTFNLDDIPFIKEPKPKTTRRKKAKK